MPNQNRENTQVRKSDSKKNRGGMTRNQNKENTTQKQGSSRVSSDQQEDSGTIEMDDNKFGARPEDQKH